MYANAHNAYLEDRVLSADPLELVRMLYQAACASVRDARRYLAAGEIAPRSRAITKACAMITELMGSLDRERGGEIADRLAQLYEYMHRKLVEANIQQNDAPLAEVLGLLATLSEAWDELAAKSKPAPHMEVPWDRQPPCEPAAMSAVEAHAWSF